MLEQIYTSAKAITGGVNLSGYRMAYVKSWDALIFHDTNYIRVSKLFRDGSMRTIIGSTPSLALQTRVQGQHCWMDLFPYPPEDERYGAWYGVDELSGFFHNNQRLNGAWVPPAMAFNPGGFVDDTRNLILWPDANRVLHFVNTEDGTEIATMTLPGAGNLTYDHLAWAGVGKVIAVHFASGTICLIDYLLRTIIWTSTIRPCTMAAFDCIHNLVISVESDKLVRLYTTNPAPANLSSPVFSPATDQHRLMGSRVLTRLTGSAGEACPGYWINWSLAGIPADPPKGALLKNVSKTDANGYAENYYFGPREVGSTGYELIQVGVRVPS